MIAEKKFRRLNAPELLEDVYAGKTFVDGVAVNVKKVNGGSPPDLVYTPLDVTSGCDLRRL